MLKLSTLAAGLVATATSFTAQAASVEAQLADVQGRILVETGDGSYNRYEPGSALQGGDRVILTEGASATLMADGCSVALSGNSIHTIAAQPCALVNAAAAAPSSPGGGSTSGSGSGWLTAGGLIGAAAVIAVAVDSSGSNGGGGNPPNISPE